MKRVSAISNPLASKKLTKKIYKVWLCSILHAIYFVLNKHSCFCDFMLLLWYFDCNYLTFLDCQESTQSEASLPWSERSWQGFAQGCERVSFQLKVLANYFSESALSLVTFHPLMLFHICPLSVKRLVFRTATFLPRRSAEISYLAYRIFVLKGGV